MAMQVYVEGTPAFRYLKVVLDPGDTFVSEAGAMASMDTGISFKARLFGGVFSAALKKLLGKESLFVNHYVNRSDRPTSLILSSGFPGDVHEITLSGEDLWLEPGSFLAADPGIELSLAWGGLSYLLAGEGLFKLKARGQGRLWVTCYGAIIKRRVDGEYIVDTGHLVAFDSQLIMKTRLAGGVFSSFFGGEGIVTRVEGQGWLYLQSRSVRGFADWLIPKL
jgi:uncharacterized protein (TIGR00266 family)